MLGGFQRLQLLNNFQKLNGFRGNKNGSGSATPNTLYVSAEAGQYEPFITLTGEVVLS